MNITRAIRTAAGFLVRFAILWFVDALSLLLTSWILPGVNLAPVMMASGRVAGPLTVATAAACLLTAVNFLIRPVVIAVARPLGWIALFVVGFVVNAAALWLTAWLLPGFDVDLAGSILGGIVFAFFNSIITGILDVGEEGSWYQNRIEQRAREEPYTGAGETGRGLMMLEIDGLSYWHIRKAIDAGHLPTLRKMIKEDGYVLSRVDCGLPSMTSSCQAGIMFGENDDIPAYRWYDKQKQKLYVSAPDATELNARYARGQGLMRHGSSIMNMMAGDAEKSLFTMANLWDGSEEENERRAADVALLLLNPYFLANMILLFCSGNGPRAVGSACCKRPGASSRASSAWSTGTPLCAPPCAAPCATSRPTWPSSTCCAAPPPSTCFISAMTRWRTTRAPGPAMPLATSSAWTKPLPASAA